MKKIVVTTPSATRGLAVLVLMLESVMARNVVEVLEPFALSVGA
jgi:hypothetical protein